MYISTITGDINDSFLIAKLYNQGTALTMISSSQKARVEFKTGHNSHTGKGFRMSYRSYGDGKYKNMVLLSATNIFVFTSSCL